MALDTLSNPLPFGGLERPRPGGHCGRREKRPQGSMLWGRPFAYVHYCVRPCSLFARVGLDVWVL